MGLNLGNTNIGEIYLGNTKIAEAYLGSSKIYGAAAPGPIIEWDTWNRSTYNDTSWQSTLVTEGTNGTVTISTASQFINMSATVNDFYANNSLTKLDVNLTKHFRFNDTSLLTDASTVYSNLRNNGIKAHNSRTGLVIISGSKTININGNGHVLQGLYCYNNSSYTGGSFGRIIDGATVTINNLTFDKCLFRSNIKTSAAFLMINNGAHFNTNYVNFNKCAIASESTSAYQCIMFGFKGDNNSTSYNHTQISTYGCGFKGNKSWSDYSCGCGCISDLSGHTFNATWNNATYISPFKLGGSGTMKLYAGSSASTTYNGNVTYYNVGSGITAQGTDANTEANAISTFNNTVTNQDFTLVLDGNGNLYHKCEI